MATGKRVSAATKAEAVKALSDGLEPKELKKLYKVALPTIKKWARQSGDWKVIKPKGRDADPVKDAICFLELAEKAVVEDLTTRKRKRISKAESYTLLALTTLRGG